MASTPESQRAQVDESLAEATPSRRKGANMERFVEAVRLSVWQKNWYGALAVALTMPDICAQLENPTGTSRAGYVAWFDRYLLGEYTIQSGPPGFMPPTIYLSGNDCYALRCSYLHTGVDDITQQSAREALDRIHFIAPQPGLSRHRNRREKGGISILQLQVDQFCEEMCQAVEAWMREVLQKRPDVQSRAQALIVIDEMPRR
jgi:hypothetical protein